MADEDPQSPLSLSQSNNLVFYISRNHELATRADDVCSLSDGITVGRTDGLALGLFDGRPCQGKFRPEYSWCRRQWTG